MTHDPDPQTEAEILAFVHGQLDGERRHAVLDRLARDPDRAAGVMAELALSEGLRLALARVETPAPEPLRQAARRLAAAMSRQRARRRWLPVAAGVALVALGWGMAGLLPGPRPDGGMGAVLDTALDAQDAVLLRASLVGELGPMPGNPEGIAARIGIDLPDLPPGWSVRAAQVVATPERPGLALVIDTPDMGEVLLFSVLRSVDGPDAPAAAARRDGRALAFFERDRTAFVLVDAAGNPSRLRQGAEALRNRFN